MLPTMSTASTNHHGGAGATWRRCLASAFRTALACTIVGATTLYGPKSIARHVAFPTFSYVTAILIVTDAALGDALRGCWLAALATVMGACPAVVSLRLIGPARLTAASAATAVAMSAFVVALPENIHLIAKRIALGQIVLVYVVAFINGGDTDIVKHPLRLAASTAAGAAACALALLLPFPSLAYCEVTENSKLYIENASERLKLFMKAFSAEDKASPKALISQAESLNKPGNKLLSCIKSKQDSMQWEINPFTFFKSHNRNPSESLQSIETILRGMENALENCSKLPYASTNTELEHDLARVEQQILNQFKNMTIHNTVENKTDSNNKFYQDLSAYSLNLDDLPSLFFVFCLKLLQKKKPPPHKDESAFFHKLIVINKSRILPALRCSLSLGFAVLFGLVYSKENGYWSGLPVAISLASAREATFRAANMKAQGTVLGTVYGVICSFVFEHYAKIRFVSLLPWFIFCSFLRQSRMYGHAGGVSAVIGAVLILGRKNFEAPSDFAIARIVETFIGLGCSIMVDILLQPTRASDLAKLQLSKSLQTLQETICWMGIGPSSSSSLEESLKKLRLDVNELGKLVEEAEVEPNFWFFPFHGACYTEIKASLLKMVDFLHFGSHALRFLEPESENEVVEKVGADLNLFKECACGFKCLEEVILVKSIKGLEKEYVKRKSCLDLEKGRMGNSHTIQWSDKLEYEEIEIEDEKKKKELFLSLSALVYCMNGVVKESREIEKGIKGILQWENPSMQVDLNDILCKLRALKKKV